jgi:hypothetical protein
MAIPVVREAAASFGVDSYTNSKGRIDFALPIVGSFHLDDFGFVIYTHFLAASR